MTKATPFFASVSEMLQRWVTERASRSRRVATSESPSRTNSSAAASWGRSSFLPLSFSLKILSQSPRRSSCASMDCSVVLTLAYPTLMEKPFLYQASASFLYGLCAHPALSSFVLKFGVRPRGDFFCCQAAGRRESSEILISPCQKLLG